MWSLGYENGTGLLMDYEKLLECAYKIGLLQVPEEILELVKYVDTEIKPKNVLEIGCFRGGTFFLWSQLASGIKLGIDLPNGNFSLGGTKGYFDMAAVKHNMQNMGQNCHVFLGDSHAEYSLEWVKSKLKNERLDLLFIDGDHTYDGVKRDYEMYSPLLKKGGVTVFHDINETEAHRNNSCHVFKLWKELKGKKTELSQKDFWAGIGIIEKE